MMKRNILLFMDEMYQTGTCIKYLLEDNFSVIRKENLNEILERLSARDIDLLIINSRQPAWRWPGTGCIEVLKHIRQLYTLPIAVFAEVADWDKKREYLDAGANEVIQLSKELPDIGC